NVGNVQLRGELLPNPNAFQIALHSQFLHSSQRDLAGAAAVPSPTGLRVHLDCVGKLDLHRVSPLLLPGPSCVTGPSPNQMTMALMDSSRSVPGMRYPRFKYVGSEAQPSFWRFLRRFAKPATPDSQALFTAANAALQYHRRSTAQESAINPMPNH